MRPRSFITVLAALGILASGCTAVDERSGKAGLGSDTTEYYGVRLPPPEQPLYGKRENGRAWRTSGYRPRPVTRRPYTNRILLDGMLPAEVDEDGVRLYERDGQRYYHPVAIAQFALAKLDVAIRRDSEAALNSAKVNAAKLVAEADEVDGGLYFPYPFDFSLGGIQRETLEAPWWSAMAQGQALSLFSRLHEATGEPRWRRAARKTFRTLDDRGPRDAPWSVYVDRRHYLWFEEYAGNTKPLLVLNGHMFSVFGLWDYHRLTGSARAEVLFDGGVTLLREYLPLFRVDGGASYYCLRSPQCIRPKWQNEKYHGIVIEQMRLIADMTDDRWFRQEAKRFVEDFDVDAQG